MAIAGRSQLLALAATSVLLAGSYVALFGMPGAEAQPAGYTGCVNPATGYFRVLLWSTSLARTLTRVDRISLRDREFANRTAWEHPIRTR